MPGGTSRWPPPGALRPRPCYPTASRAAPILTGPPTHDSAAKAGSHVMRTLGRPHRCPDATEASAWREARWCFAPARAVRADDPRAGPRPRECDSDGVRASLVARDTHRRRAYAPHDFSTRGAARLGFVPGASIVVAG